MRAKSTKSFFEEDFTTEAFDLSPLYEGKYMMSGGVRVFKSLDNFLFHLHYLYLKERFFLSLVVPDEHTKDLFSLLRTTNISYGLRRGGRSRS